MPVAVAIMAVLCAVSLFVMLRLADSSRYGVRCLTFAFTAAAALCALTTTIIFFGLFAIIYGAVAVILLALTATARSRMKRRQNI